MRRRIAAETPWEAFWAAYSVVGIGLEVWVLLRRLDGATASHAVRRFSRWMRGQPLPVRAVWRTLEAGLYLFCCWLPIHWFGNPFRRR